MGCDPGDVGTKGVANILIGAANPSGRTPDIYPYAAETTPSYCNLDIYGYYKDGFLAGSTGAHIIAKAKENGMYCCMKLFAPNGHEANRHVGLYAWASEQAVLAGGTSLLFGWGTKPFGTLSASASGRLKMWEAAHQYLYTIANSYAADITPPMPMWRIPLLPEV